jgi:ornithine carbamoyltransferase
MRHILSLKDQSKKDITDILAMATAVKKKQKAGKLTNLLPNKTLVMLFQKGSTRTRLSFEAAMTELGGHSIFLDMKTTQFALTDFKDEIKAVMRFGSVLMFRALKAADVQLAADQNQIPVIDACSEKYHPAQALGDILTMIEHSGGLKKVKKVVWLGIENNVSNTLSLACAKLGIKVVIVAPEANKDSVDSELNKMAEATGNITRTLDLKSALKDADYVHTDTWMDMEFFEGGKVKPAFQDEYDRRKKLFMPYQLNAKLIDTYAPKAKIMHCMPCHVGYEISRDAIDHKNSVIFDQAENRMHAQKAMILWLLGKKVAK